MTKHYAIKVVTRFQSHFHWRLKRWENIHHHEGYERRVRWRGQRPEHNRFLFPENTKIVTKLHDEPSDLGHCRLRDVPVYDQNVL